MPYLLDPAKIAVVASVALASVLALVTALHVSDGIEFHTLLYLPMFCMAGSPRVLLLTATQRHAQHLILTSAPLTIALSAALFDHPSHSATSWMGRAAAYRTARHQRSCALRGAANALAVSSSKTNKRR